MKTSIGKKSWGPLAVGLMVLAVGGVSHGETPSGGHDGLVETLSADSGGGLTLTGDLLMGTGDEISWPGESVALVGASGPILNFKLSGSTLWFMNANSISISGGIANGPSIRRENASATNPTLLPNVADAATGIGAAATNQLSLIAGSLEGIRVHNDGSVVVVRIMDSGTKPTCDADARGGSGTRSPGLGLPTPLRFALRTPLTHSCGLQ